MLNLGVNSMLWQCQEEVPVTAGASLGVGHGDMLVFGGPLRVPLLTLGPVNIVFFLLGGSGLLG